MAILPCVEGLAAVSVQESRLFVRRRQSSVQIAVESGTRSGFVDPRPLIDAQRTEAQPTSNAWPSGCGVQCSTST